MTFPALSIPTNKERYAEAGVLAGSSPAILYGPKEVSSPNTSVQVAALDEFTPTDRELRERITLPIYGEVNNRRPQPELCCDG